MKKINIIILSLVLPLWVWSQTFEIKYTQTMDIEALEDSLKANESASAFLSNEMREDLFSQMAKPQDYFLVYSNGKSLYKIAPEEKKEEEEEELEVGQGFKFNWSRMRRRFSPVLFKDFGTNQYVKEQGIMDKKFLIQDTLRTLDWEITDKTKTFGDFTCTVAKSRNAVNQEVLVCFTEDIPINEGPDDYYGLPGLVVEVVIGPLHIDMTEIKIVDENKEVTPPTEGKKVSQEEFDALRKEKFGGRGGGRGMSIFH